MIIDRTHRRWSLLTLTILLIGSGCYVAYARTAPNGAGGGSVAGIVFGILGTAMMLFAGLLPARKQVPTARLGSAQFWLRGHIWIGLLSFPFILFHAGFGWGGLLENVLWIVFGTVIVSGLFGVAVQQILPRILTSEVPLETFTAQIPYQCRRNQFLADKMVAELGGTLDVHFDELKPIAEIVTRQQSWVKEKNWDADFPKFLAKIYSTVPEVKSENSRQPKSAATESEKTATPLEQARAATSKPDDSEKPMSPLEQMRARANKGTGDDKPKSPLEQARAPAAGKVKGKSPLELAREQAAKKAGANPEMSPLEQARAQAAKKKGGASPLELARAQGAKKADKKPGMSPLEQARAEQAKRAGNDKSEPETPPAHQLSNDDDGDPLQTLHDPTPFLMNLYESDSEFDEFENRQSPVEEFDPPGDGDSTHSIDLSAQTMEGAFEDVNNVVKEQESSQNDLSEDPAADKPATPASKPDQTRSQAAPKAIGTTSARDIIERARAAAAAKKAAANAASAKEEQSEQDDVKSNVKEVKVPEAENAAPQAEKPLSRLEQIRAAAAAKAGGDPPKVKSAARATPAPKGKPPIAKSKPKTAKSTGPIPGSDELKSFYVSQVRPFLGTRRRTSGPFGSSTQSAHLFAQMQNALPPATHEVLQTLSDFCEERRQFEIQKSLHRWLHWWLFLHIPLSLALFVLVAAHIVMALRVVPYPD